MRLSSALLQILFFHASQQVAAVPFNFFGTGELVERLACAGTPCGSDSQYCCTGGATCFTTYNYFGNPIAGCAPAVAGATAVNNGASAWVYFTTTYVVTGLQTVVSTGSYQLAASTMSCLSNETPCGSLCCKTGVEMCYTHGDCRPLQPAGGTVTYIPPVVTSTFSSPVRGTSVIVATISVTTTEPFRTPISTAGGTYGGVTQTSASSGLSGGAIAGIVIGVLAGIIILILICFCCCVKAGFQGVLAIFGLGSKKRRSERTEVTETRYSRHGSQAASRREHRGWFGGGGGTRYSEKTSKKKEGGALLGIAAALGALWLLLGLKRKNKPARSNASDVSYSYYTETGTSRSSISSRSDDRRTRNSRASRPASRRP